MRYLKKSIAVIVMSIMTISTPITSYSVQGSIVTTTGVTASDEFRTGSPKKQQEQQTEDRFNRLEAPSNYDTTVLIEGVQTSMPFGTSIIQGDRVIIPGKLFPWNQLGLKITWSNKDQTAIITDGKISVTMQVGSIKPGETFAKDVIEPMQALNNQVYISLSGVVNQFPNLTTTWVNKTLNITPPYGTKESLIVNDFLDKQTDIPKFLKDHNKDYPVLIIDGVVTPMPISGVLERPDKPKTTGALLIKSPNKVDSSTMSGDQTVKFIALSESDLMTPELIYLHEISNANTYAQRAWPTALTTVAVSETEYKWLIPDVYLVNDLDFDYASLRAKMDPTKFAMSYYDGDVRTLDQRLGAGVISFPNSDHMGGGAYWAVRDGQKMASLCTAPRSNGPEGVISGGRTYVNSTNNVNVYNIERWVLSMGSINAAAPAGNVDRYRLREAASWAQSNVVPHKMNGKVVPGTGELVDGRVSIDATAIWLNSPTGVMTNYNSYIFDGETVKIPDRKPFTVSVGLNVPKGTALPGGTTQQSTNSAGKGNPVPTTAEITSGEATMDWGAGFGDGEGSKTFFGGDGSIKVTPVSPKGSMTVTVEHMLGEGMEVWVLQDSSTSAQDNQWNDKKKSELQVLIGGFIGYKYTHIIEWDGEITCEEMKESDCPNAQEQRELGLRWNNDIVVPDGGEACDFCWYESDCPISEALWEVWEGKDTKPRPIPQGDEIVIYDDQKESCWMTYTPPPNSDCPSGCPEPQPREDYFDDPIDHIPPVMTPLNLRWNNIPSAFGEAKMGTGYQQFDETTYGGFTTDRGEEVFDAMMGMPETERLYFNAGSTEGMMDVKYEYYDVNFNMVLTWKEQYDCPRECEEEDCSYTDHNGDDVTGSKAIWTPNEGPLVTPKTIIGTYWREHKFEARFLHLKDAGYTTAELADIVNDALLADPQFTIEPTSDITRGHMFVGNLGADSQVGPGVGNDKFNLGATIAWTPVFDAEIVKVFGLYDGGCAIDISEPMAIPQAEEKWNEALGEIFAQNDGLVIRIGINEYPYAIQWGNYTTEPLEVDGDSKLYAAADENDFTPKAQAWESLDHVPVSGFNGHNLSSASRNTWLQGAQASKAQLTGNNSWIKESQQIIERRVNGVYSFQPWRTQNLMNYPTHTTIKGVYGGLIPTTIWEGMSHGAKEVVAPGMNVQGNNKVLLEYTSWQTGWGGMMEPNQSIGDASTETPPSYYSVNPVIIHNPTANLFAWVHDVPNKILEDQRIYLLGTEAGARLGVNKGSVSPTAERGDVVRHHYALDDDAPARLYIDFDFRVTIPNDATLIDYWHPTGPWDWGIEGWATTPNGSQPADWSKQGIVDLPEDVPNLRGKGYDGDLVPRYPQRYHGNPYSDEAGWDIRKWINAKFIQFPFDSYYYGTIDPRVEFAGGGTPSHTWGGNAHTGGDPSGFYPAGTWIMLYDNHFQVVGEDPIVFDFRVASNAKDSDSTMIKFVTENINARDLGVGSMSSHDRGQFDWTNSEWANNGRREHTWHLQYGDGGDPLSNPLAAQHATRMEQLVHIVGRIGNVSVDDNSDPRWSSIFWNIDGNGNPQTGVGSATNRIIAGHFNMYESLQNRNFLNAWAGKVRHPAGITESFLNRYGKLAPWHATDITISSTIQYILPLMRNPITQYDRQVTLLGYEIQYSVQTIGDYDRSGDCGPNCPEGSSMIIQPQHNLVGAWDTVSPGERWFMYASDPYDPRGHMRMFYDSALIWGETPGTVVNNDANYSRNSAVGNGIWRPEFIHNSWKSLADTRAKVNNSEAPRSERDTPSYTSAVQRGSQDQTLVGTPSFINIKQPLRTWQGSSFTKGRTGEGADWVNLISSNNQDESWKNVQRWHGRFSLPRTTKVISASNLASSKFEGSTTDQMISTSFAFRTNSCNTLWDLAIFTNTSVVPGTNGLPDYPGGWDDTPKGYVPGIPDVIKNRRPWNWGSWTWVRRPHDPSVPPGSKPLEPPNHFPNDPGTPIIVVDYSNPAQSDSVTIGTH